jgi:hypothetical protein
MGAALYARSALGILAGLAASLLPWPAENDGAGASGTLGSVADVALLAPRGRVTSAPTRVVWTTALRARRARLRVVGNRGEVPIARTVAIDPDCRELLFSTDEQRRLEAASAGRIELTLMSEEGELLGIAPPARFTLPPWGKGDGW